MCMYSKSFKIMRSLSQNKIYILLKMFQWDSFQKLSGMCDVIVSCHNGPDVRQCKFTNFTADAFVAKTKSNIASAKILLSDHQFQYVLPLAFGQDPLEKFLVMPGNDAPDAND
ncbi:hypothetical protein HELRODRAFT_174376 [Helobdella robusta]|uniref:Uncharacterized protein n=1 Tax=Helobdella robusta TaxID=6412 RepID=T1F819_HELRO|nr:hypothetical protein HELRODRAFT_174376 [Helobdella robusta]ESO02911.1 hypothetical protein HELRODRAFT_174376 [Helobdella robusta]